MRVLYSLLGLLALLGAVLSQTPIPNRPDGYSSPAGGSANSPVVLEIFVDLLCPDSQAAWPTIKSVISSYGGQVQLITHLFPLPYHTWAFIFAQGALVVDENTKHNVSAVYNYFDWAFNIQAQYYNGPTAALSTNDLVSKVGSAVQAAGILSAQTFIAGINDVNLNMDTRVAWKYGCSRAVSGTPSFLINGVYIGASASWTVADWKSVIDPLLAAYTRRYKFQECPAGTTFCQYNKTASECCIEGEWCIPNVGCRC